MVKSSMLKLYTNINQILTLKNAYEKDGRKLVSDDLSVVPNGAVVFDQEKILWVGSTNDIPKEYKDIKAISLAGHILTPEIVDSHTHLVFGGNRSGEYTMRLDGASYEEIATAGGGILNTVTNTRSMSEDDLFNLGVKRIQIIHNYGVGSIEIKSGYGLDYESEYKCSLVIDRLKKHFAGKVQIFNTFLAAHAVPKEFKSSTEYLNTVVLPLLDNLAKLSIIDAVDIFHEQNYFNEIDVEILFKKASELGIKTKIHADEFNDNKGAVLAAKFDSLSADHLLATDTDGINALAKSNVVATLLPGTSFFLGKPLANARKFLDAGCKIALASDYNPGSCHCDNLLLITALAAKNLNMNTAELWSAITLNAAHAIGYKTQGAIVAGLAPRFSIFSVQTHDEIFYNWGKNLAVSL
jgi:imidazolonepropionase